jgi:hypothetical protein
VAVFEFSEPIKNWIAFAVRKHGDMTASMIQGIHKGEKT